MMKERWVLVVFVLGALVWARDAALSFAPVPAQVQALVGEVRALSAGLARLDAAEARDARGERSGADPALAFPGDGHRAEDAVAGSWTEVRLRPVRRLRAECRDLGLTAWLIDADGRWFAAATTLGQLPVLAGDTDFAFGVRVGREVARGRAKVLVQVSHDCGTGHTVSSAPPLQFTVHDG